MSTYELEDLSERGAPYLMAYLIKAIDTQGTLMYGDIAEWLARDLEIKGRVFSTHVGYPTGRVMEDLQQGLPDEPFIPLINVLVIRQDTKQPGKGADGFLQGRFGVSPGSEFQRRRKELVDAAAREVYSFGDWRRLYGKVYGHTGAGLDEAPHFRGKEREGDRTLASSQGGGPESQGHKRLKAYVLSHPGYIGASGSPSFAKAEVDLVSGDRVDVMFETGDRLDIVEVKSSISNNYDLQKGVYQCVKYRAVLKASRLLVNPNLDPVCTLVVEKEPELGLLKLAKLHNVKVRKVRVPARFDPRLK